MSLRELDLDAPVSISHTKKNLVSILFERRDGVATMIATYEVPQADGSMHRKSERKLVSDMMTPAQRKSLIDKVVA